MELGSSRYPYSLILSTNDCLFHSWTNALEIQDATIDDKIVALDEKAGRPFKTKNSRTQNAFLSHPMICGVVPFQVNFRRVNRFVDRDRFFGARAAHIAIVAIPGTPHCTPIGFLHVDSIAYAFSHIVQFLNFFGCHHRYLLKTKLRAKKLACPGTKSRLVRRFRRE
jgi:hypothetical protein